MLVALLLAAPAVAQVTPPEPPSRLPFVPEPRGGCTVIMEGRDGELETRHISIADLWDVRLARDALQIIGPRASLTVAPGRWRSVSCTIRPASAGGGA